MGSKDNMNVVMFMTDQMHKYALGAVSDFVKTPNLDKLAQKGTLFTNCYSNNPVCTPVRGLMFSGRYSSRTGCMGNENYLQPDELCLGDQLNREGIECSFVGKLHLGDKGNKPIEKRFFAGNNRMIGYQCHNGFIGDIIFYDEEGKEHRYYGHRTDFTADVGIERIEEMVKEDKNFVETIFFQAPHYPVQPSPNYYRMYDGVEFPEPEEYSYIEPFTGTGSPLSPRPIEHDPNYQWYGGNFPMYWKLYYALVTQIDANVGKVLDRLEELGIADNTTIMFSSDHGDMQGSHGMLNKCLPYERSCGVPLIINVPNMEQKKVIDTPVSTLDLYPTCLEVAGVENVKKVDGVSLVEMMSTDGDVSHPDVYCECITMGHWILVRDSRYKFVMKRETLEHELLFDMIADPTETKNLVGNSDYAQVEKELAEKLTAWFEDVTTNKKVELIK